MMRNSLYHGIPRFARPLGVDGGFDVMSGPLTKISFHNTSTVLNAFNCSNEYSLDRWSTVCLLNVLYAHAGKTVCKTRYFWVVETKAVTQLAPTQKF